MSSFASLKQQLRDNKISYTSFYRAWENLATIRMAILRQNFTNLGFDVYGTSGAVITLKTDPNGAKWKLSIIYPDDRSPGSLEALLMHDGNIVHDFGYEDICLFNDDFNDILAEVRRLILLLN